VIAVADLVKSFDSLRAVDGVSFALETGSITGLIGPNGAGKTTLFNTIAGVLRPNSGTITLDGTRVDGLSPDRLFRRGLARTFQIPRPFAAMTVLENVMLAAPGQAGERFWQNWLRHGFVGRDERALRTRAMEALAFTNLDRLAAAPARTLSGGQHKLLELARILLAEPKVILLDEPAAGVTPALMETLVEKIVALNRRGITFLIIEHNMDLVMSICRPILVMAQGRLIMQGDADAVRADPRVIDAYLGGAPQETPAQGMPR
jgi:branched-chain amino acid transport system ATP-binding protein